MDGFRLMRFSLPKSGRKDTFFFGYTENAVSRLFHRFFATTTECPRPSRS